MKRLLPLLSLVSLLLLSACSSYYSGRYSKTRVNDLQRIYVINNLDDNRRVDLLIVAALLELGKEASSGPETMIPENTQALITYRDAWSWDFTDHITHLQLQLREPIDNKLLAASSFHGPNTLKTDASAVCRRLSKDLFTPAKRKK